MGSKLTALVIMGFVAVAGLSISSGVSCLPLNVDIDKNATTNAGVSIFPPPTPTPTKYKMDLVLKVEAVYHEGKVKKFLSYSRYLSPVPPRVDPTGTPPPPIQVTSPKRLSEEIPQLPKYTEWFHRIPPPSLPSPILTLPPADTTCLNQNDFLWLPSANTTTTTWMPPKEEESYNGLLSQCDPHEYPIPGEPRPDKFWYSNSCSSSSENGAGGGIDSTSAIRRASQAAIPLYTIYVGIGTPNHSMTINPVANFNLPSFLQNFPFDRLEIQSVVIKVALYSDGELGSLKNTMKDKKYFLVEDDKSLPLSFSSDSDCFMVFLYDNTPVPKLCEKSETFMCQYGLWILLGVVLALIGFCIVGAIFGDKCSDGETGVSK